MVYLNPSRPSIGCCNVPRANCLFARVKARVVPPRSTRTRSCKPAVAQRPFKYLGASTSRKADEAMMPPMAPKPICSAVPTDLLDWQRMLFDWYARTAGILPWHPALPRKIPKYRMVLCLWYAVIISPAKQMIACAAITGARVRYLSPSQAKENALKTATNTGGAERRFATPAE